MYMTLANSVDRILRYSVFTDMLARRLGVLSAREDTAAGRQLQIARASACHRNRPLKQHGCYSCAEEAFTLKLATLREREEQ